jgi:hypothetical protein
MTAHALAREAKIKIAELARHHDIAAHRHVVQIIRREAFQNADQPRTRASATVRQGTGAVDRNSFTVKQPIEQPLWWQRIIQQLIIRECRGKRCRRSPALLLTIGIE